MKKMTIVANSKAKHEETEGNPYDYWKEFKDEIIRLLKRKGTKEDLYELVERAREDVRENKLVRCVKEHYLI